MKSIYTTIAFILFSIVLFAQDKQIFSAKKHLKDQLSSINVSEEDINQSRVSSTHYDKVNKAHFIYLQQTHQGIDIYNAITSVAVTDNDRVFQRGHAFITELEKKEIISSDNWSAIDAFKKILHHKRVPIPKSKMAFRKKAANVYEMSISEIAYHPVIAERVYYPKGNQLILSWRIEFDNKYSGEITNTIVDAGSGKTLEEAEQTLKCFGHSHEEEKLKGIKNLNHSDEVHQSFTEKNVKKDPKQNAKSSDGAQYRVYPYYVESPSHGQRELITEPSDSRASPFGWHDINGVAGPEFTITRGNNAHAYLDKAGTNQSSDDEPDGGSTLIFDRGHDLNKDVTDPENEAADVIQLYYMGNFMHDWIYGLGFDEAAGNFQENNYGRGGFSARDEDPVILQALDNFDGGSINNANFSVTSDGSSGRMQMFKWEARNEDILVDEPANISGSYFSGRALFGPGQVTSELSGRLILTQDGFGDRTDACETITNGSEVNGNIALIRRGECFFSSKVFNAQQRGARAAIVCNNVENQIVNMAGADNADDVTIPAYFMTKEDCDPLEQELLNGNNVNLRFIPAQTINLSSSFDNGIIAHEYGHGISIRLTGGASRASCLQNDEEMGEGWSDFFGLVVTQREGDKRTDSRGVGTFVTGNPPNIGSIRRQRYSTDTSINDQTMNDIRGFTTPHPLGEIWAGALWELYWDFIDEYGYDFTWENEESGNHKAIRLIVTGMKLQPCSPGFIEGRDAILEADQMLFDGEHECMLWSAFARRGIGFDAFGGSRQNRNDNVEGFEVPPTCIKTMKISQEQKVTADQDSEVEIKVTIRNDRDVALSSAAVTASVPENSELVSPGDFTILDNGLLRANVDGFLPGQEMELSYTVKVGTEKASERGLFDDFGPGNGFFDNVDSNQERGEWQKVTNIKVFGNASFNIINDTLEKAGFLTQTVPVLLDQENPGFRFWHRYTTEFGFDGGIIQISEDGGSTWAQIPKEQFIDEPYNVQMIFNRFGDAGIFDAIDGFTGNSFSWVRSIIDLSSYKGKEVLIRYWWQSDPSEGVPGIFSGWFIDYVDYLDLGIVQASSCLQSEGLETVCDTSLTVINTKEGSTPTNEIIKSDYEITLFPNPVEDLARLRFNLENRTDVGISILDISGKMISSNNESYNSGRHFERISTADLPDGTYVLQMTIDGQIYNEKFVKATRD